MKDIGVYLAALHDAYPSLHVASATLSEQGQNNDVVIARCDATTHTAAGQYVFRFPRYSYVLRQLKTETAVLLAVRSRLPLPVPVPSFVALDMRGVGHAFVGYEMLPGAPLWREIVDSVRSESVLDRLAQQLGGFLRALHACPAGALPVDLPRSETPAGLKAFYARVRDRLFPHMPPGACARVADLFESYLDDARHFAFAPVLRHGDFGSSNILSDVASHDAASHDAASWHVSGIVDFNGVAWGDPAYDAAGLLASYGEGFLARCARGYPAIEGFIDRARFYRDTFALEEALFGLEVGDDAAFIAGMAGYVQP
jgi:aminoglycoside 2''-phosphotransferase